MVKKGKPSIDLAVDDEVAQALEYLRERVFVSSTNQREISRALGLGRDYVHQVLRGHVDLKLVHMLRIARILGLPSAELYRDLARRAATADDVPTVGGVPEVELRAFLEKTLVELGLLPAPDEAPVEAPAETSKKSAKSGRRKAMPGAKKTKES
jgi:transcriptional regulator with XRE-family HTH domain